jgi:hypothetical protein
MELSDTVNAKKLVGRRIFLHVNERWEEGTVYTSNDYDLEFLYSIFSNCVGSITVTDAKLEKRGGANCFELQERTGCTFYSGGKNPFTMSRKLAPGYVTRRNFLDSAIEKSK